MAIKIGVIGTSDIARRRMIPAIKKSENFEYIGVAIASRLEWDHNYSELEYKPLFEKKKEKAQEFITQFGGKMYLSYESLLADESIDAVYIPLPPALHYKWAILALKYNKHVLLEKPACVNKEQTEKILTIAEEKKLAVVENYGFVFHNQFNKLKQIYESDEIGSIRLIRGDFGFPHRLDTDFRYFKKYGGGALLDCGGYTIKAASEFMNNPQVMYSSLKITDGHEVDVFGNVILVDENGVEAHLSFGMDNSYKCNFELWGSYGSILLTRAYTAPDDFSPVMKITTINGTKEVLCEPEDQFLLTVEKFYNSIINKAERLLNYDKIKKQSILIMETIDKARK